MKEDIWRRVPLATKLPAEPVAWEDMEPIESREHRKGVRRGTVLSPERRRPRRRRT